MRKVFEDKADIQNRVPLQVQVYAPGTDDVIEALTNRESLGVGGRDFAAGRKLPYLLRLSGLGFDEWYTCGIRADTDAQAIREAIRLLDEKAVTRRAAVEQEDRVTT